MYLKDLNHRVTVRFNDDEYRNLLDICKRCDMNLSQVLRGILTNYILRYHEVEHEHNKTI